MRTKGIVLLVVGAIILIIGVAGFVLTSNQTKEYETGLGQMARGLDSGAQSQYEGLTAIKIVSIIMIVIGGLLVISGFVTGYAHGPMFQQFRNATIPQTGFRVETDESHTQGLQHAADNIAKGPTRVRYCKRCGQPLASRSQFCTQCGTPIVHAGR